jgi:hypothetical protein
MADPAKTPGTPVAQPRAVEISMIANFPPPWKGNQALEIAGMKKGANNPSPGAPGWAPSNDDFNEVIEADVKDKKSIFGVNNTGDFIGAIQSAKPGTIARLNLITHSNNSIIALKGDIDLQGVVTFPGFDPSDVLATPRLNTDFFAFLNGSFAPDPSLDGKALRDDMRTRFRPDAELFIYGCDGGVGSAVLILQDITRTLGIAVHAFKNFIDFQPIFDEAKSKIFKASRARCRYQDESDIKKRDPDQGDDAHPLSPVLLRINP